jgi:hypothetical protein
MNWLAVIVAVLASSVIWIYLVQSKGVWNRLDEEHWHDYGRCKKL